MLHFVTTVDSEQDPLTFIVENSVPYTFSTTQTQSISIWMAIPINFISITSTFVWNYLDALILIISIGLSTLFELFNDQLMETQEVHAHAIIILIVLFTKLTKLTAFSYCSKCRSNFGPIEEFNMSSCVTWSEPSINEFHTWYSFHTPLIYFSYASNCSKTWGENKNILLFFPNGKIIL